MIFFFFDYSLDLSQTLHFISSSFMQLNLGQLDFKFKTSSYTYWAKRIEFLVVWLAKLAARTISKPRAV